MKYFFVAILLVLWVGPAGARMANLITGNDIHEMCGAEGNYAQGACMGFIIGVERSLEGAKRGMNGLVFCRAKGVNNGQTIDVVKRWLKNNPSKRHFTAPSVIAGALSDAFPCK